MLDKLTLSEIVRLYNTICESKGTKTVSKFSERKVGEQRLQNLTLGMERATLIDFCTSAKLRQEVIDSIPTVSAPVDPVVIPVPAEPVVTKTKKSSPKATQPESKPEPSSTQPIKSKKVPVAAPAAQPSTLDSENEPQTRGRAKLMVLSAIRKIIPDGAKGEAATTTSTLIAKNLHTTTTAVIRELERLGSSKLVKLEDDSPDTNNRLFYVSLTAAGKAFELPADLSPAVAVAAAAPTKPAAVKKVLPAPNPGPRSKFNGKTIHLLVDKNPRREGTCGWNSFNVIKEGITYEQYREAGGRNNDLQWDIDHGYLELKQA